MPKPQHEAITLLFRNHPALAAEILGNAFDFAIPHYRTAHVEPGDPTGCAPDAVVVFESAVPVLAVAVEVLRHRDHEKRWNWPVHLAGLRARLRCPAVLLVICLDSSAAAWCARPIDLGHPGWTLTPLVLGRETAPAVSDRREAARMPELALLSAVAHGECPGGYHVVRALHSAFDEIDEERAALYADIALAILPEVARNKLEEIMVVRGKWQYQSEFARTYFSQGKAEGEANAILSVLAARGIAVPDDERERIAKCTDLSQLDEWVRRAVTAESVKELFE